MDQVIRLRMIWGVEREVKNAPRSAGEGRLACSVHSWCIDVRARGAYPELGRLDEASRATSAHFWIMLSRFRSRSQGSLAPFIFRVSDALAVPMRGVLLRLRLVEGEPDMRALAPGERLRLRAPDGEDRVVQIVDRSVTGGRATQRRLERTRELDIVISDADATRGGRPVAIGWEAMGPVTVGGERAA